MEDAPEPTMAGRILTRVGAGLLVVVFYVASVGPVILLLSDREPPRTVRMFYAPLEWAAGQRSGWPLRSYANWWRSRRP